MHHFFVGSNLYRVSLKKVKKKKKSVYKLSTTSDDTEEFLPYVYDFPQKGTLRVAEI